MLASAAILFQSGQASAMPASSYAASSVLSSGKWAKVRVDHTGMQFLSNTQLKNLGFANPDKVNVYGYGGRMISEVLDDRQIDDLPQLPLLRTATGIYFFGVNSTKWETKRISAYDKSLYTHTLHAYEEASYYFISDRDAEDVVLKTAATPGAGANIVDSFTERLLHENDLACHGVSGRQMVGEDFRTQSSRTFPFELTDNAGGDAMITVRGIARVAHPNTPTTMEVAVNGKSLGQAVRINSFTDNNTITTNSQTTYTLQNPEDKLDINIKATPPSGGVVYMINLDYIKVEYSRKLQLRNGELYFYHSDKTPSTLQLSGCSPTTQIWDVTDITSPSRVEFTLSGSTAEFGQNANEYHEYIAFEPDKITRQPVSAGSIANQDIHSLPVPDMLIISPAEYVSQSERLADMHRRVDGMTVHVITPEALYNEFSSGTRDISAFRKAMKMWYDRGDEDGHSIRYCLIMSRPTYDNKRLTSDVKNGYPRVPIWQSPSDTQVDNVETSSYSCDDIIGMLEDTRTTEFSIINANVNVAVGRMPVKSVAEATAAVDKIIKYVEDPDLGSWRNSVMLVADDENGGDHFTQTETFVSNIAADPVGASFVIDKVYFDAFPLVASGTGQTLPGARSKFFERLEDGVMFVSYVGHGQPRGLGDESFYSWEDIINADNKRLPFFYTATCQFCPWDANEITAGEELFLNPSAGYIGLISTNRSVFITENGYFTDAMSKGIFSRGKDGRRNRVGDMFIAGKNGAKGSNRLRYIIVGDPALQLPIPTHNVTIEKINGQELPGSQADSQILGARATATVEGKITDNEGNIDTGFNGFIELILFDAEKVVTTIGRGDGDKDKPRPFNDRSTRLFRCIRPVVNGEWNAEILVPLEIENNFSPALISAYAYSNEAYEANGQTDKLYVYGYDETAPDDNEGPVISGFTLNNETFRDGSAVNSSPLVLATISDESGINTSQVGIGHSLTLTLDGKKTYSDVSNFFTPSSEDPRSGSISYLLEDIEPGNHTLTLTAWDNAGNHSTSSLSFSVGAHANPVIYGLTTDKNPATTSVTFIFTAEQPEAGTEYTIDVFDLNGRRIWTNSSQINSSADANVRVQWNLCDAAGHRVPRGIYLYRATITTSKGIVDSATKKLAVTAQ